MARARRAGAVRPLVVTDDAELLDDLLRLTAAAGVEVEVAGHADAARAAWAGPPLVLVGRDLADALADAPPPRRPDVVLVSSGDDGAGVWERAVSLGAEHVVVLPDGERWLVDRLGDARDGPSRDGAVLCVVGARGGAGASTLAAGLAVVGARAGHRTLLVDGDPWGGGLDLLLAAEETPGPRWPELAGTRGRVAASALEHALPRAHGMSVLSWDRGEEAPPLPGAAMAAAVDAGGRGFDLTVVDVARTAGPAGLEALARASTVLLLVPAEVRAVAAAARVRDCLLGQPARVGVVVRPGPRGLDAPLVAESLGLPLLGVVAEEPGLAAAVDRGEPPAGRRRGPLAASCRRLLDTLDVVPARDAR